ncbi:MAG: hypothetical protein ABFS08_03900 [Pseudomonadota bacterium]
MSHIKRIKLLLLALFLSIGATASFAEDDLEVTINQPPISIEQWYKPANKRQVWLHTMFRLRREMQAISEYSAYEDRERLVRWTEKFRDDYRSIGKMVPEWADELELGLSDNLLVAANKGDYQEVASIQQKIGRSCMGCHKEFRAVTAALYRGANFSDVVVENGETMEEQKYKDAMTGLSTAMNRIKIAIEDDRFEAASSAYTLMEHRLGDLSESCSACHKTDRQRDYLLGKKNMNDVKKLGELIEAKEVKQSQRALGGVAVQICATCHSIHRTLSDLRGFID